MVELSHAYMRVWFFRLVPTKAVNQYRANCLGTGTSRQQVYQLNTDKQSTSTELTALVQGHPGSRYIDWIQNVFALVIIIFIEFDDLTHFKKICILREDSLAKHILYKYIRKVSKRYQLGNSFAPFFKNPDKKALFHQLYPSVVRKLTCHFLYVFLLRALCR